MRKLKKILKTWSFLAVFMVIAFYAKEPVTELFYITFIAIFAISGIFILFGWDKYITTDDDDYKPVANSDDDYDGLN